MLLTLSVLVVRKGGRGDAQIEMFFFLPYTASFLGCHYVFRNGTSLSISSINLNIELIMIETSFENSLVHHTPSSE